MSFTDIFIRRPVLATVVSLLILVLGVRALGTLQVLQYPKTQNAIVTVTTVYYGADPNVVSGFITTPRTVGRTPNQRTAPALPNTRRLCSSLPTSPIVARQST